MHTSSYQEFVKTEMPKLASSSMKPKDKMKHIAMLWHKHKASSHTTTADTKAHKAPNGGALGQGKKTKKSTLIPENIHAILEKYNC